MEVISTQLKEIQTRHWIGFFALCLLSSSAWLVESAWPSSLPLPARQGLDKFAIAIVLFCFGLLNEKCRPRFRGKPWAKLALSSVLLLAVPALLLEVTSGVVSQPMGECLFALVPVAVVVLAPYFGLPRPSEADKLPLEPWRETSHLLLPALVGLGGVLLLLSFSLPESLREAGFDGIVLLAVAAAAIGSIIMYRLLSEFSLIEASAIYCGANALAFAIFLAIENVGASATDCTGCYAAGPFATELAKAILFELPQVILLLWLLRALPPPRFAARYLLVPLMLSLESFTVVQPTLTVRLVCALVLLATGIWRLLTAQMPKGETFLMLP
jgi:hypothetical protein